MSRAEFMISAGESGPGLLAAELRLPDGVSRTLRLEEVVNLGSGDERPPIIGGTGAEAVPDLSWAVIGALPLAMSLGVPVRVAGPVQHGLPERLEEFSRIWHDWCPDSFRSVRVTAEAEADLPGGRSGVAVALSGGVDSLHTLEHVRHSVSGEPVVGVMMWGFDYRKRDRFFLEYARRTADVLEPEGVRVCLIDTNWVDVASTGVTMDFATGLTSALQAFSTALRQGFAAADYHISMTERMLPHGSNPITNPLLSTESFPVTTFGYESTRLEKLASIIGSPAAMATLRVCNAANCGVCEKCQRTRWALFALGCVRPPSFGASLPLPRPWLGLTEGHQAEHFDGYWSPILEWEGVERQGKRGLTLLRLQYWLLRLSLERRGLWKFPPTAFLLRKIAGVESRIRGTVRKRWLTARSSR